MAEGISTLSGLVELRIDGHNGGVAYMWHLLHRLSETGPPARLRRLILDTVWIDHFAADTSQAIRDILQQSHHLREFLFFPHQGPDAPTEIGGDIIFSGLHGHPSINCVETAFFQTQSNTATTPCTVRLLQNNQVLQKLAVSCHDLIGLCSVVETLIEGNTTLEYLVLSVNSVEDRNVWGEGHALLSSLLPRIRHLKSLELMIGEGSNKIDPILPNLIRGFELNQSLTFVSIEYLQGTETEKTIDFYTTRNRFGPELEAAQSKVDMLALLYRVLANYPEPETGLSLAFETLRMRDDWCGKIVDNSVGTARATRTAGKRKRQRRHC